MNDIFVTAVPGLTVTVDVYSAGVSVGSVSATEIGGTGVYMASMPSVAYGKYMLIAMAGTARLATGEIMWSGQYEILESMANFRGLNPNAPWTITPTGEDAGGENLAITGDGETESIVTKQ